MEGNGERDYQQQKATNNVDGLAELYVLSFLRAYPPRKQHAPRLYGQGMVG